MKKEMPSLKKKLKRLNMFTLRYENKEYVLDEQIPTIDDDSTQEEIEAHQKHYDDQGIKKIDVPSTPAAPVLTIGHNAKKRKTCHSNWKGKAAKGKSDRRSKRKAESEMTKSPFIGSCERDAGLLDLVHTDVCGPFRSAIKDGKCYYVTFPDDFSRYGYVYFIKHKSDTFEVFKRYQNEVENQLDRKIKLTPPRTPQLNGVAERRNRTLLDMDNVVFVAQRGVFLEREMISKEDNGSNIDLEKIQESTDEEPIVNTNTQPEVVTPVKPDDISLPIRKTSGRNLVDTTPGLKMVGCKWIFKKKIDMNGKVYTYKARLIAKGYTQTNRIDYEETFSPVDKIKSIRIMLSIAAFHDYKIWQMDVKIAFLNEKLIEEVFMTKPEGFENAKYPKRVCKLQKAIYGLKHASRSWNLCFHEKVTQFGFSKSEYESCIYVKQLWFSIKKLQGIVSYEFLVANKKCTVNTKVFRIILDICLRVEGVDFTDLPDDDTALTFLIDLGYKGPLNKHTNMFVDHMHQAWITLAAIINKCLSRKTIDHRKEKRSRRENMPYPRFIKIIINHFLKKYKSLTNLNYQHYHTIKDDGIVSRLKFVIIGEDYQEHGLPIPETMLTEAIKQSKSYQMFIKYSTGQIHPKKSRGKALIKDENAIDKGVADTVKDHKRKHDDDDEDPPAGQNQGKKTKRRRTKEFESSKKPSSTKETPKGKAPSKGSKTGKFASPKEPVEEAIAEVVMDNAGDDVVHDDDQPQEASEPKTTTNLNQEWFKQPPRPPTPDTKWNKRQVVLDQPKQPWFNKMVSATKDPLTFNDLMDTLIDFSKYVLNGLKINNLTQDILLGPSGHQTVVVDYFFNNDLDFLKTSGPEVTYTTSITKTKETRYEIEGIEGIEDMVPTLWSPTKVGYDKDALKGIKQ
nr:retrotransposon protein, putative, Ty1-copia subclass [Tanacetum cinerariifolium]